MLALRDRRVVLQLVVILMIDLRSLRTASAGEGSEYIDAHAVLFGVWPLLSRKY